ELAELGARAMTGEPTAGLDARLGTRVAVAQHVRHARALAKALQRERGTAEITGHPQGVAFARSGTAHRSLHRTDHADIDHVFVGARQISTQHPRVELVHHGRDTRHDFRGGSVAFYQRRARTAE